MEESNTCFPDEVLLNIFSHLCLKDIAHTVQLVCKRWRKVANDPTLWKELLFSSPKGEPKSQILCILAQNPEVYSISMPEEITGPREITISCGAAKGQHLQFCTKRHSPVGVEIGLSVIKNLGNCYENIACTVTVENKKYTFLCKSLMCDRRNHLPFTNI